jgi:DNA polymerase V
MDNSVAAIYRPSYKTRWLRPLVLSHVAAGFPSPAEDYIEGRIDLNRDLIKHPIATFYIRVAGDSMTGAGIGAGDILIVDRAAETCDGHIIVARINDDLCVKQLCIEHNGKILLLSANDAYPPIEITDAMDFEVWGRVMWSIKPH